MNVQSDDVMLTISEASRELGVSIHTLQRTNTLIPEHRTSGGHRRYRLADVRELGKRLNRDKGRFRRRRFGIKSIKPLPAAGA